ncbi:MAG: FMN-binding protein [Verrucomicrobiota bacterium]
MKRRSLFKWTTVTLGFLFSGRVSWSKTYLTVDQARKMLWGDEESFRPADVDLTKDQMKAIRKASRVRVRNSQIKAWRTSSGGWFILDQVIGKHENIDLAVALTAEGKVKGVEVLVYRETYGHQIMNPKWRAQFTGRDHSAPMRLDKEIKNISGATLSCRHVADGLQRLCHTWNLVLRAL